MKILQNKCQTRLIEDLRGGQRFLIVVSEGIKQCRTNQWLGDLEASPKHLCQVNRKHFRPLEQVQDALHRENIAGLS